MNEFTAEQRARKFVQSVNPTVVPVPLEPYLAQIGARLSVDDELESGEAGYTMTAKGRHSIFVNGNDSPRRQRFTACHEIGHVVLELESEHGDPSWSYERRPPNEVCCDIFAAELLLPVSLFRPALLKRAMDVASLHDLAEQFEASLLATGSRMVAFSPEPCAFVVSQGGKVKYAFRSASLRSTKLWIPSDVALPETSYSAQLRKDPAHAGPFELDADVWFDNADGGTVVEDAIFDASRDQVLTLLFLDSEDMPEPTRDGPIRQDEEDTGLKELDGHLPWPSKG